MTRRARRFRGVRLARARREEKNHRLKPSMKATDFARQTIESQIHFPQPVQK